MTLSKIMKSKQQPKIFDNKMTKKLFVGNDIIDIDFIKTTDLESYFSSKSSLKDYVEMTMRKDEIDFLFNNYPFNNELKKVYWIFFAAKEAAYKLLIQAGIEISNFSENLKVDIENQKVNYIKKDITVYFKVLQQSNYIHVTAVLNKQQLNNLEYNIHFISSNFHYIFDNKLKKNEDEIFSKDEYKWMSTNMSVAVRYHLKEYLKFKYDFDYLDFEILKKESVKGKMVPFISFKNQEIDINLSLSHHGNYVAYAYNYSNP